MKKVTWILVALLVVGALVWLIRTPGRPGKLDTFATCLKDKGVLFYGAFWCPHCQAQKALFGPSVKLLPYVECSNPDGNSQNQTCNDKKISSYPTWVFPDGSEAIGEQSLVDLAKKSSCELPQ